MVNPSGFNPVPNRDPDEDSSTALLQSTRVDAGSTYLTRASLLFSIPHLIALISLLILSIYVWAKVRTEAARQLKAEDLARRCAFVYLVTPNHTRIDNLGFSLQSLNKYFNIGTRYKILIVHSDIPPVVQGRLQALSEAPIHFREIHFDGISFLNGSADVKTAGNNVARLIQETNRFWCYSAILAEPSKSSVLSDVDYVVRLDADSAFTGEVRHDFMRDFVLSGAQYGYLGIAKDCGKNSTFGLRELALSYVDINGISPRSAELWASITNSKSGKCLPTFESRFEVMNLQFFRSHSGVQDWIRVVDADGGMYTHEWTDAALRYITVSLYAAPEKLVKFGPDVIPYKFSS